MKTASTPYRTEQEKLKPIPSSATDYRYATLLPDPSRSPLSFSWTKMAAQEAEVITQVMIMMLDID